jgi:nucleotide-binding universal stress UspA family protein
MFTPRTLLVAHDFSKRADRAVRRARLLSPHDGRIVLFHATLDPNARNVLEDRLMGRARLMFAPEGISHVDLEIGVGAPSDVAANLMQSLSGDLLVVGLHSKKGIAELLKTNTMARMVSAALGPTLIAKASPPKPYRNILVGIDFAQSAASALALARDWFPEAAVSALHAFDLRLGRHSSGPVTFEDMDEGRRRWLTDAVAQASPKDSERPVRTLLLHGPPAEMLRRAAVDHECDLIVVGRHNRGWLIDALLGSVCRTLLADPPCDILVVSPGAETFVQLGGLRLGRGLN